MSRPVNSSFVLVQWLRREAPGARLFVVGEESLKHELRQSVPLMVADLCRLAGVRSHMPDLTS